MSHANTNLGNARHKGKFVSMSLYNKLSALKKIQQEKHHNNRMMSTFR